MNKWNMLTWTNGSKTTLEVMQAYKDKVGHSISVKLTLPNLH